MTAESLPEFGIADELKASLGQGEVMLLNAWGSAAARLVAELRVVWTGPILVVVPDPEGAADFQGDLELFDTAALPFPAWDLLPSETGQPDVEIAADRVAVLRALAGAGADAAQGRSGNGNNTASLVTVVAPVIALMQPSVNPKALARGKLAIEPGMEISPEGLAARLVDAGLEHLPRVDGPGQFSRHGGIMDVFPLFADAPVRIEFFDDEIETLRFFDPITQASGKAVGSRVMLVDVTRDSFQAACMGPDRSSMLDFLPRTSLVVVVHPLQVRYMAELYASGFAAPEGRSAILEFESVAGEAAGVSRLMIPQTRGEDWPREWGAPRDVQEMDLAAGSLERLGSGPDIAIMELARMVQDRVRTIVFCHNQAEKKRVAEVLQEKAPQALAGLELRPGHLSRGFQVRSGDRAWALLTDHEIFGRFAMRRTRRKRYAGIPISDFTELEVGDYVVHVLHGIARYEGMRALEQNNTLQDYLVLRFAEEARIYVPLSHVDLVQRYVGSRDGRPTLSRLGGRGWARRKQAAAEAVRDIAADLLRLQAVRRAMPGIAFKEDDELQKEFDASFPYDETPDQVTAMDDIKADQVAASPMDRLLCGDVGFGKTELAIRAAFKVALAGKQVAVLVPTTILAEQHFRTFTQRMAEYPVIIGCLSRFRTAAEQRRIIEAVREGQMDIVIGTHRLLSKDVAFKDLGLVVIDEEQRFGVEHKERFKRMRASVDVLTMTATPIPRTLHMSLVGLRDISNLATPPAERQSVRTVVTRASDDLVRRAILREIARGGQCYFVHNRVHNIDQVAARLAGLVPEARVGVAHGQMREQELLDAMLRFLDQRTDVLVCTTIIESGVDIPTVNTLIVNDADHFGLSDLHQLRGRVGRYRHQAYAYFLLPPRRPLTPIAQKRLSALEEYSELGAGFRLAMRDLEIRGAGNVLGVEQSGHIHQVGFDLYCRLLERAVAEFNGNKLPEAHPVELDLGTRAFVPDDYISAQPQRVEFYRRLSACQSAGELAGFKKYTRERYGRMPESVLQCFADQDLRIRARNAGINFLGRIDDALAVAFVSERARDCVLRLRTMERRVTPLGKGRWRVGCDEGEDILAAAKAVVAGMEGGA